MTEPLKSWSFSRYKTWASCPRLARYRFIDKLKEPPAAPLERGDRIHKAAEAFLKGNTEVLDPDLSAFAAEFDLLREKVRSGAVQVEATWAFRKDWTTTRYNDWNGCWLRVKVDAAKAVGDTMEVYDWKTGKMRAEQQDEYAQQLELYALGAFRAHPHLRRVSPYLVYTDQDYVHAGPTYTWEDEPELRVKWEQRVAPMMEDRDFLPNPGNACRWCHFRRDKGGPCQYP